MTGLTDAMVAVLFVGALNVFIIARILSTHASSAGRFLARVYVSTLLLRGVLAIALNVLMTHSSVAVAFWGDSGTYDTAGYLLARNWGGEAGETRLTNAVSGWGFVYIVGAIYFVLGRNQLLVQLLNCTVGAVTVLVVYAIADRLFGRDVGRRAALMMAFFPQMIFWSAGMYKDPSVLLGIAVCMYAVLKLKEGLSIRMLVIFLTSALALLALRFYIFYFVTLAALGTFVFGRGGSVAQRLLSYGVLTAALVAVLTLGVKQETLTQQAAFMTLSQVQVTRADQAMWGQSSYGTEHDVSTLGGALAALPMGLLYLLFAPFPWAIRGARQLLTLPETLVWYGLMPAFVVGLLHAIRHRLRDILPILVFTVTLTAAYALMQGNVGTAYRQRTQVTMFFFVFMGVGLQLRRLRRTSQGSGVSYRAPPARPSTSGAREQGMDHDLSFEDLAPESGVSSRRNPAGEGPSGPPAKPIKDDDFSPDSGD